MANTIMFSDEQVQILHGVGYIGTHFIERDLEVGVFDVKPIGSVKRVADDAGCKFPRAYCLEMVAMLDHENVEDMVLSAERLQQWLEGDEV